MLASDAIATCPLPGCDKPAAPRSATGACCRTHGARVAARRQARSTGYVPLIDMARLLKVDRRILEGLIADGIVASARIKSEVCLDRSQLAAWAWSRPRCCECHRRVLGHGPGCTLHPHHGKVAAIETREKQRAAAYDRWGTTPPELRKCGWCSKAFQPRSNQLLGRFCSRDCTRAWVVFGDGSDERFDAWIEGKEMTLEEVNALKAQGYLEQSELGEKLPVGHRRSSSTVSRHESAGLIEPAIKVGASHLYLPEQIQVYNEVLKSHPDGRLTRFNAASANGFRADWKGARFGGLAKKSESARIAHVVSGLQDAEQAVHALILERWEAGDTLAKIVKAIGVSESAARKVVGKDRLAARKQATHALILERRNAGDTLAKIAEVVGVSKRTVCYVLSSQEQ